MISILPRRPGQRPYALPTPSPAYRGAFRVVEEARRPTVTLHVPVTRAQAAALATASAALTETRGRRVSVADLVQELVAVAIAASEARR